MTEFLTTPVDKSLSTTGSWVDIDLSSDIPSSATGAIFQVISTGTTHEYGLRKKGSSDNRHGDVTTDNQCFCIVGIDSNRKCQGYIEHVDIDFYLVGYTEADITLFTNGIDKSLSTVDSWVDIDLSANLPSGAVAAIFESVSSASANRKCGFRKKGSSDDRHADIRAYCHHFFVIGVDANRKCQGYAETTDIDFYLMGYLTQGQAETTGVDRSLGVNGTYIDITESGAPAGATGAFGETFVTGTTAYMFAARKNGTSYDYYHDVNRHTSYFVGLDASKKWEGKIQSGAVDFFTLGYFVAGIVPKTSSDSGSGTDAVASGNPIVTLTKSDTGSGVDTRIDLLKAIAKESDDTGVGVDARVSLHSTLTQSDTGTGIESLGSRLLGSADQGTGADALFEVLAAIAKLDSGVGTDALVEVKNIVTKSDSGTGTESAMKGEIATIRGFFYAKLGSDNFINPPETNFGITTELNNVARFDYVVQNNAANRTLLTDHLTEDFEIMRDDNTELLTGSIDSDSVEYFAEGEGGAGKRIRFSGYASFIDLAYQIFKRMKTEDAEDVGSVQDEDNSTSTFTDYTTAANNDTINDVLLTFGAVNDALYIGKDETFFSVKTKYSTKGIQAASTTVVMEYSKGSGVWATLDCIDESYAFTKSATPLFDSESFETGFGKWTSSGDLGWTRNSGSTTSDNTGPDSAYDGDWYIYTEASTEGVGYPYKVSYLTFDSSLTGEGNVNFWYHKYGIDCGPLELHAYYSGAWHTIWSRSAGDEGNTWFNVDVTFPVGTTNIRFKSTTGDFAYGDTALDLIKVSCSGGPYLLYIPNKADDWAKDTVNGVSNYWIRFRISQGSYSTLPKLDRIWLSNADVCRVQFNDTAADTILGYILEGTGYSEDTTDQCPTDTITIRGEYDSKLRWIFGLGSALTWEDGNGDKQQYDCWIDTLKNVHYKQQRGTDKGDVSAEFRAVNNKMGYHGIGTRIFGAGGYEGINQKRAIVEDTAAQATHKLREIVLEDSRITGYEALKAETQKSLTIHKAPLTEVSGDIDTKYWLDDSLSVGDKITINQPDWNLNNQELYIMRAAIDPANTHLDLGTSQMHLEHMRSSLQRQMDIDNVWMHGAVSTYVVGPEEDNYEREDDTTVHPVRMTIDVPTNARAINHVEISWSLMNYQSSVKGSASGGGHSHGGASGGGGGHGHSTSTGGDHWHSVSGYLNLNLDRALAYTSLSVVGVGTHTHSNPGTSSGGSHTHGTNIPTSYDDGTGVHNHSVYGTTGSGGSHSHSQGATGSGGSHTHSISAGSNYFVYDADISIGAWTSDTHYGHNHPVSNVGNHGHSISYETNHEHSMSYGMHEESGGTTLELYVGDDLIGNTYVGDQSGINITGWITTGSNRITLKPIVGDNVKGRAQLSAVVTVFLENLK